MTYNSPPLESAGEVRVTYEDAGPLEPMPYDDGPEEDYESGQNIRQP